jgi:hypothetical protein
MARYLIIGSKGGTRPTEVEATNVQGALKEYSPSGGADLMVYRVASGPVQVRVISEVVQRYDITNITNLDDDSLGALDDDPGAEA